MGTIPWGQEGGEAENAERGRIYGFKTHIEIMENGMQATIFGSEQSLSLWIRTLIYMSA